MSPAERRARRDASAQARINPDTGVPFRNYNQLDTWQRNQKAKKEGFTSRAQKRGVQEKAKKVAATPSIPKGKAGLERRRASLLPNSYHYFLHGRESTEETAREFNRLFTKYQPKIDADERFMRRAERDRVLGGNEAENWPMWRNEYDSLYNS